MKLEDRDIFKISLKSHNISILELDSNVDILVNESKLRNSLNSHAMSPSNIFLLYFISVYLVILTDSKKIFRLWKNRICSFVMFYFMLSKEKVQQNGVLLMVTSMADCHDTSRQFAFKKSG